MNARRNYNLLVRLRHFFRPSAFLPAAILLFAGLAPNGAVAVTPCPDTNVFSGISGLSLWLRADCVNGVADIPADNSTISTWSDLSGNSNNATSSGAPTFQSDSGNLINSQPVINFNGSSSFSSIDIRPTTRPNLTIFAVYKERGSGSREGVWGIDDGGWDRFFIAKWSGNNGLISVGNQANVANTGVIGSATLVTTVMRHNVSNGTTVYVNGASAATLTDGSNPTAAYTSLLIGSGGSGLNFTGDIAEIVIFTQALTNSDLITVNGYLNTKYGLNISSTYLPVIATAPTFNSFALTNSATTATYRTAVNVTANVNQSAKITFTANGKTIAGCKNRLATGSSSSYSVTCSWRPSNRGLVLISAQAIGTYGGLISSPGTISVKVDARLNRR